MMIKLRNIFSITVIVVLYSYIAAAQVTKNNLDQNADQSQGNYAATNLNYLGGYGSLGMMQSAWKDPLQHMGEGQTRPGYSKYYWTPDLVLPVRVREGMYTLINFPKWEVIENVYLGDGQSFTAQIQGPSSLMVYPDSSQFVGVDTNMIVFGRSGNKYVFYVQSETVNTDRITNAIIDIEVVDKNKAGGKTGYSSGYGSGNVGVSNGSEGSADSTYTRDIQKEDWIEKIPVDPTQFRFDIEVYVPNPDDIIIAPERVWRDNIFTYIDLGEKALTAVQRPIVTLIVERSETPVGFRSAGPNNRLIIVEGMGDMVLRSGKRLVCLKLRRADSDGLENTVYAKTNDWDLQSAHASKAENLDFDDADIEDVFGEKQENEIQPQKEKGFFDFSSFFGKKDSADDLSNMSANDKALKNSSLIIENNKADAIDVTINSIPKVAPKISPVIGMVGSNATDDVLEQVDIKYDNQEIVVPEYSNQNKDVNINVVKDLPDVSAIDVSNGTRSNVNDANPVLITYDDKKDVVSNRKTDNLIKEFMKTNRFENKRDSNISIELGTDESVNNLEKLWSELSKRYSATLGQYNPFYSVEAPADGQGKELFHLRVGPVNTLEEGDKVCSQLGRNGIFCSVVRIQ